MNDPTECLVTWPTDPTDGDLIPLQLRPQHSCRLKAEHVHYRWCPSDHVCHCGATLPARDLDQVSA